MSILPPGNSLCVLADQLPSNVILYLGEPQAQHSSVGSLLLLFVSSVRKKKKTGQKHDERDANWTEK